MSRTRISNGKTTEISGSVTTVTMTGNISMSAAGQINNSAEAGLKYGVYNAAAFQQNNPVPTVKWYDINNNLLDINNDPNVINGIKFHKIAYGEKVRFEIEDSNEKFKNYPDGTPCMYHIRPEGGVNPNFGKQLNNNSLAPTCTLEKGIVKSVFFTIPLYWYHEEYEEYDYTAKVTKVSKVPEIMVFDGNTSQGQIGTNSLKPYTYFRNYEEIVGLFNVNNSGNNSQTTNYENKFINTHDGLLKIVDSFLDFLIQERLDIATIEKEAYTRGLGMWSQATVKVQGIVPNLDDRPLYWARNKMSAYLKRHPLFKDDIDYDKSLVKKDSNLSNVIKAFEIASRNYQVSYHLATSSNKKVLVTGFDPFLLDSIKHTYKDYYNILQSNPSGVVALALNGQVIENAYIQTMMIPVRYSDFDSHQENNGDQPDKGIIEDYIGPLISGKAVDMVITVSQSTPNSYHIDVFATATRGGLNDNLDYVRKEESKSVSKNAPETIETTLPKEMDNPFLSNSNANSNGLKSKYYGKFKSTKGGLDTTISIGNTPKNTPVFDGPGGNYLSNEIFYRVAKVREDNSPTLPTGHFHIAKKQLSIEDKIRDTNYNAPYYADDLKNSEITEVVNEVKKTLAAGFKTL